MLHLLSMISGAKRTDGYQTPSEQLAELHEEDQRVPAAMGTAERRLQVMMAVQQAGG